MPFAARPIAALGAYEWTRGRVETRAMAAETDFMMDGYAVWYEMEYVTTCVWCLIGCV